MPYIAFDLEHRIASHKSSMIGTGQCVALVQTWAGAPTTALWREGQKVRGNHTIAKGTAIATFIDGHYPNHSHGNHAAIYIGQTEQGIQVIDQWKGGSHHPNHPPAERTLSFKGQGVDPSNNGDSFSIIE